VAGRGTFLGRQGAPVARAARSEQAQEARRARGGAAPTVAHLAGQASSR